MHILFVSRSCWDPLKGGIAQVSINLGRYLRDHGHHVSYLNDISSEEYSQELLPGKSYSVPSEIVGTPTPEQVHYVQELIHQERITHIINQNAEQIALHQLLHQVVSQQRGVALISCYHDDIFRFQTKRNNTYPLLWRSIKSLKYNYQQSQRLKEIRRVYEGSTCIVLLAEAFLHKLLDSSVAPQIDPSRIWVLSNPCPRPIMPEELDTKDNLVLFVGRMNNSKQPINAVRIWQEVYAKYPEWQMLMLGDGPILSKVRSYISKHHIERIEALGRQVATSYMRRAKILLSTSVTEGYPMVTLEALSSGTIPVSYEYTPTRNIFTPDREGVLIPRTSIAESAKILSALMDDPDRQHEMALRSLELSSTRTQEEIGQMWIDRMSSV